MLYKRKSKNTSILVDLSPLIDVVFLLLIFFMVSTQFKDDHGLDLALPGAASRQQEKSENLTISIDKSKGIFIGDQSVEPGELESIIRENLAQFEKKMVVLKVDKTVNHGLVVKIMDAAKAAGAEGLTFATSARVDESEQE